MSRTLQAFILLAVLGWLGYVVWQKTHPPAPVVVVPPTPTPTPISTPIPTPTPIPRRLAAEGTYFLLQRISINSKEGIAGYPPGTQVKLLWKKDNLFHVTNGKGEFDIRAELLTNDLDIAGKVANRYFEDVNTEISARTATGGIAIIKALYGIPGRQVDVTTRIRSFLLAGRKSFFCGSELSDYDPAPGEVKSLTLFYSVGAAAATTANIREGEEFYFLLQSSPKPQIVEVQTSAPAPRSVFRSRSALDEKAYDKKTNVSRAPDIYYVP